MSITSTKSKRGAGTWVELFRVVSLYVNKQNVRQNLLRSVRTVKRRYTSMWKHLHMCMCRDIRYDPAWMQRRMKQNHLLSLFDLRNSQTVCFSGTGSAPASQVAVQSLLIKKNGLLVSPNYPFFYLPERESLMQEACFKPPKDATDARNWLTQSL